MITIYYMLESRFSACARIMVGESRWYGYENHAQLPLRVLMHIAVRTAGDRIAPAPPNPYLRSFSDRYSI
jgi:hypothetical protein